MMPPLPRAPAHHGLLRRGLHALVPLALLLSPRLAQADPVVLDARAGIPKLASNQLSLVGQLTLGYATPDLGVVGKAGAMRYDLHAADGVTKTYVSRGSGEAWLVTGPEAAPVRFEVRVAGGGSLYKTQIVALDTTTPSGIAFRREKSLLARFTSLVGVRLHPDDNLHASVLVGVAFQHESYSDLSLAAGDLLDQSKQSSVAWDARASVLYRVAPEVVAVRLDVEGTMFHLTRQALAVGRAGEVTLAKAELRTVQVETRLFAGADGLKWLGLMPGAFLELDVFSQSGSGAPPTAVEPIVGLGVISTPGPQRP